MCGLLLRPTPVEGGPTRGAPGGAISVRCYFIDTYDIYPGQDLDYHLIWLTLCLLTLTLGNCLKNAVSGKGHYGYAVATEFEHADGAEAEADAADDSIY